MNLPAWLKPGLIGAVGGGFLVALAGFAWAGWMTTTRSGHMRQAMADQQVIAALVPVCVERAGLGPLHPRINGRNDVMRVPSPLPPKDRVQVCERNGIWAVKVDRAFRGDYHARDHAEAAAAVARLGSAKKRNALR